MLSDELNVFKPDSYLGRIKYAGPVRLTEKGLRELHLAQICTIPFENFDILLGRGAPLEPGLLFNKLIHQSRGGYCFELNGLFLTALKAFGFEARPLLARVHLAGEPTGRTHQISLVKIKGREWLSDVGFGAVHMLAPILLEVGSSVVLGGHLFRLIEAGHFGIMLQTLKDEQWQNLYSFDLSYVYPGDIFNGNYFTSTHPDSFFKNNRMASLPNVDGQVSLFNDILRFISGGEEKVQKLSEGQTYLDALKIHFGIEFDEGCHALPPML